MNSNSLVRWPVRPMYLVDAIREGEADAVLCASIFHYGHYTVGQAKEHMAMHEIPVRV